MLLGGIVLYCAYYACDQTQAQRLLAASNDAEARSALVLNGVFRFPLVLTYCLFGLLIAGLLATDTSFAAAMSGQPADAIVPTFILTYLPSGLRGLLIAAILAAAMSSLDSALNSLAAVTLEDVAGFDATNASAWAGRAMTFAWGVSAILSALVFARGATGVLELITRLGSVFYGPALAVFVAAATIRNARGVVASLALVIGLAVNVALARYATGMSSLWWNVFGFLTAYGVLLAGSRSARWLAPATPESRGSLRLLGLAAVVMVVVIVALPTVLAWIVDPAATR
jgi:Na+/proline symporter